MIWLRRIIFAGAAVGIAWLAFAAIFWHWWCQKIETFELVDGRAVGHLDHINMKHRQSDRMFAIGEAVVPTARVLGLVALPVPPEVESGLRRAEAMVRARSPVRIVKVTNFGPWYWVDQDGGVVWRVQQDGANWSIVDAATGP